ncbi:LOW QUALITY PROTEIN: protein mono-ADP-ribosyltransferase PARP14-like [Mixophyes fleayi]|uniref:LOW QUALITY PROTEIN: protein mono-ADP-ribosyltransferase PARP14-like n=1 Tax=Mixophyes fleayi TaxID=3061075 RepID=UPI003F4D9209
MKNKLLLYFQSRRKSNGGECEIRGTECSQGHVLIHFREQTVRDQVLQKQIHEVELIKGKKLKLEITLPNSRAPQGNSTLTAQEAPAASPLRPNTEAGTQEDDATKDPPSNVVLIENVQDTCSPEMINLLVENISEKNEDRDFYVELIPEIRSAAITFTCDIDIPSFMRNFSSSLRVNQNKLTAKHLEETRSIRVENLPQNISEDFVIVYFESPKHGGGRVQETVMLPEEGAALIIFYNAGVVKTVLKMSHVLDKTTVTVFPYYPSLKISLYGKTKPSIKIPEPLEFHISPYILEYIVNNKRIKHDIDVRMVDRNCEITWPDIDCSNPVIKLRIPSSLSTHLRTMAKVVRTWNDEVSAEFSLIISKYKVIDCKMNPSVWEAITEHVCSSTYEGVLIKPDFAEEKVFLAGTLKDVKKIEPTFRKLVEGTTKQVERKNQSLTMTVPVSPALYHIMRNSGLEKKILEDVPELKMDYDISTKNIRLTGLREEVLSAKCEILNVKQQLKSKSIQMNPHIIQFLMSADSEELSCLLFVRHNINALFEVEDNAVKLIGHLHKDLTEAEGQMKQELVCRQIPVEEKSVLRIPEWRSLHSHLSESFNGERSTVLIEEFPVGAENDVVITGLSTSAQKSYQIIYNFLEENSPIQINIPVRSSAMMQFIVEEKKQIWGMLKENVKVVKNQNNISLSGPRTLVEEADALIRNVLSLLHCDTLRIVKPGAEKFCKINKEMHATTAKTRFNCVICLQTGGDYKPVDSPHCQVKLPNGMSISVYKDDLCHHNVDVIVNAANEDLKHIGGLALAILKAAGDKLQDDCDRIVRKEGKLSAGKSVITDAGNLPCKQVIHTVGPRWSEHPSWRCERLLREAITSSLEVASDNAHSSIAIPAVSSGVFGFPLRPCVEIILEAIKDYVDTQGTPEQSTRIHLVDMNVETVKIFSEVAKATFGDEGSSGALTTAEPPQSIKLKVKKKPQVRVSSGNEETVMTKEGLIIMLVQKNIEDATTEVIVNSVGADLNLANGGVSKALYQRAGDNLQQLLHLESVGVQVGAGSVFKTDSCNLGCKKILHVVMPPWDNGRGGTETIFRGIIKDCLTLTEQHGWKSISFPAMGTGQLHFPRDLAASVMFDEIFQFSCRKKTQNLQEIHLVLYPKDKDTIKAFSHQLTNCTSTNASNAASNKQPSGSGSTFCGTVTNPSLGVHEIRIGPVTYQVKTGDITKEKAEIIVNSSNQNFTLCTGVSKAILEAAGPNIVVAANALGSQPHKGYIITPPGNLVQHNTQCKWILHVVGPKQPADIKKNVLDSLQECEKNQVVSVAFPALGTGAGGLSAAVVADTILDSVVDFVTSKSVKSVQTVKVVIFQQNMLNDFYVSMKKKEGTALSQPKSFFSKLADFFVSPKPKKPTQKLTAFQLEDNIQPVTFSFCAEEKKDVDRMKKWLQDQIEYEQAEKVITEEWISELEISEMQKISDLQKKFQVSVAYKPPDPSIRISGLTRDVMDVSGEIQTIINRVRDRKTRERAAELTGNLVQWKYESGSNVVPFDIIANLELEEAKAGDKKHITVQSQGKEFTVNLQTGTAKDKQGNRVQIERVLKHEQSSLSLPKHWKPMGNSLVLVVDVAVNTPEYVDVQQKFVQSCRNRILKIERIQNKDLWMNYEIKKKSIDTKNGSTNNERQLFHGTDSNSIQNVIHNGFNRSYAGRNAAAFGNGTYFAVNASYSAASTYSKPDTSGHKHMYLARVLTGVFCRGHSGMVAPPPKNPANPTDLYDSVTDNPASPSMFVIFNDIQAYPDYHITFC